MTTPQRCARAAEAVVELADDVGVTAWVHARRLGDAGPAVDVRGGEVVPMASVYKLPLAACWADLVAVGELDPRAPVRQAAAGRTAGPTGVSALLDDVVLSQRDTVRLMLAVSDNASAGHVLRLVGVERLRRWLEEHGLPGIVVRRDSEQSWTAIARETGATSATEAPARLASVDADVSTSEYDTVLSSVATAADLVGLLELVWATEHQQVVRDSLSLQAWRHRVGSGFPHDDVAVHGKTGTLGRLRHEVAVVEFPHEVPVGVAVLTKSARAEVHQPRVDAVIGAIARVAVTALRRPTADGGG